MAEGTSDFVTAVFISTRPPNTLHLSVILPANFEIDALDSIGSTGGDARIRAYCREFGKQFGFVGRGIHRLTRIGDVGLEQRAAHEQVPVEQFPLVADFDRRVLLRPEDLVRTTVDDRGKSTVAALVPSNSAPTGLDDVA